MTSDLQKTINIQFKNSDLLSKAFVHRSFLNETKNQIQSNERLEFLGDAVLELATSRHLFQTFPQKPEGELTNLRSSLVKTDTLAQVASQLKLGDYLKMSRGEKNSGGQTNTSLLANTLEALIGAIYLDQGFDTAQKFISQFLFPKLDNIIKLGLHHDFKSTLQESVQSQGKPTPIYRTVETSGPDHQRTFTVQVKVSQKTLGIGKGASKQRAQQAAAKNALKNIEPIK